MPRGTASGPKKNPLVDDVCVTVEALASISTDIRHRDHGKRGSGHSSSLPPTEIEIQECVNQTHYSVEEKKKKKRAAQRAAQTAMAAAAAAAAAAAEKC